MERILLFVSIISILLLSFFEAKAQNDTVLNSNYTKAISYPATGCLYTWTNSNPSIGLPASGSGNISSFTAVNTGNAPVTATITATPGPGILAYLSNYFSNEVLVLNTVLNTVVDSIQVGTHPNGVAVSPDGSRIYVANLGSANVSVINTSTNKVITTIPVGTNPYSVLVSHDGNHVYVSNDVSGTVSVIDTKTNLVIATVAVGSGGPLGMVEKGDGSTLYAAIAGFNSVAVISTASYVVTGFISVDHTPYGIVISPDDSKLYVACNGSNTVSVVSTASQAVIATITVGTNPVGIAISPDGSTLYVGNTYNLSNITPLPPGTVSVVNTATKAVVAEIQVGSGPTGISVTPDGSLAYVVCEDGTVSVIKNGGQAGLKITVGGDLNSFGSTFLVRSPGCTGSPVINTITVNPTPITPFINTDFDALGYISACAGVASSIPNIQQFTVSGTHLTENITATAPGGFEISLNKSGGYGNTVKLPIKGDSVSKAIIYVRAADNAVVGNNSGNVSLTSSGANATTVVGAIVNIAPIVNAIDDQTIENGDKTKPVKFTGTGLSYTWTNDRPDIGLAASGTGDIKAFKAVNSGNTPITATITVTPQTSSTSLAYIPTANEVSVINTTNNQREATIPVGMYPEGASVNPDGSRVYVSNSQSYSVSVIDVATNKVIATVPAGLAADETFPGPVAVSPDGGTVYVSDGYEITVINAITNTVDSTFPTFSTFFGKSVGNYVSAIAFSPDGSKAYLLGNFGNLMVFDTSTKKMIENIIVSQNAYIQGAGIAVSPDGKFVYASDLSSNNITVVNTETNTLVNTLAGGGFPIGICLSPDGSKLYAVNSGDDPAYLFGDLNPDPGTVSVFNTANNKLIATIPVGGYPIGISITPDGSKVYVANDFGDPPGELGNIGTVSVINTKTNSVDTTLRIGLYPIATGNFISQGTGCGGFPITFKITVNPPGPGPIPGDVSIPNAFTPNGDGINDTWNIKNLDGYPSCTVKIFDRYGSNIYSSIGYGQPWDGRIGTGNAPQGTYYYIINLQNGSKILAGNVTLIR